MAEKLVKYYEWIQKEGGLPMKMRLAMKTNTPSDKAKSVPDTPDLVQKFHQAAKEIAGKEPPVF